MTEPDRLWINGRAVDFGELELNLDRYLDVEPDRFGMFGLNRPMAFGLLLAIDSEELWETEPVLNVQVRMEEGQINYLAMDARAEPIGGELYIDRHSGSDPGFFDGNAYIGHFFELRASPEPFEREPTLHAAEGSGTLAIDGRVVLDVLPFASVAVLSSGQTILRVRLAPGRAPSPWLSQLSQRRPGRRLTLQIGELCLRLDQPRTRHARVLAPPERPLGAPSPGGAGLELEFVFTSLPVRSADRRELQPHRPLSRAEFEDARQRLDDDDFGLLIHCLLGREHCTVVEPPLPVTVLGWREWLDEWFGTYESDDEPLHVRVCSGEAYDEHVAQALERAVADFVATRTTTPPQWSATLLGSEGLLALAREVDLAEGVRRFEPETWLERVLYRWHPEPIYRTLAEHLDQRDPGREPWAALAAELEAGGDPRGVALAAVLAGSPEGQRLSEECLDPAEAQLHGERTGGVYHVEGREWAPRIHARWFGPFVVELHIWPDWSGLEEEDCRGWPSDTYMEAIDSDEFGGFYDESLPRSETVSTPPGFSVAAEVEMMLAQPCCAVLSSQRVAFEHE